MTDQKPSCIELRRPWIGSTSPDSSLLSDQDARKLNLIQTHLPEHVSLPTSGQTFSYGKRKAGPLWRLFSDAADEAGLDNGCDILQAEIRGPWTMQKQDLGEAIDMRFLRLPERMKASAMDEINEHWNRFLAEEGKAPEKFPRARSNNMHLLDRLMALPKFRGVAAISYRVESRLGEVQLCTVFDQDAIRSERISSFSPYASSQE